MADRVVVLSDMQIPYHDTRAVEGALAFVKDYKPDLLLNVGDEIDFPMVSRWSKGWASEYEGRLQADIDKNEETQARFKAALKRTAEYHIERSNHVDRIRTYVEKYGPGLRGIRVLEVPELLGYNRLGIHYHDAPYGFAPGWLLCHGDEGSLSRIPGATAKNLAITWDTSVVCGHTHRLGAVPHTLGLGRRRRTIWGVEVGNLMDHTQASYIKTGAPNWQQGIGVGVIDGRNTRITAVPIVGGQVLA